MFYNQDPLERASRGAAKGVLDWGKEEIKNYIKKFLNKELAFIKDNETIDVAKEQRKTGEFDFFKKYVKDKDYRILFQMGLTLRRLEKDKKPLKPLRDNILNKYQLKGLHIAYFIQNGLFNKYIGNILDRATTIKKLEYEIKNLFDDFEKLVIFIKNTDVVTQKSREIVAKINVGSPETFIISSSKSAMLICEQIKEMVMSAISDYTEEQYGAKNKKIFFLNKVEELDLPEE